MLFISKVIGENGNSTSINIELLGKNRNVSFSKVCRTTVIVELFIYKSQYTVGLQDEEPQTAFHVLYMGVSYSH